MLGKSRVLPQPLEPQEYLFVQPKNKSMRQGNTHRLPRVFRFKTDGCLPSTLDIRNRGNCLSYFEGNKNPQCIVRCKRSLEQLDPKNSSANKGPRSKISPPVDSQIKFLQKIIQPAGTVRQANSNRRLESHFPRRGHSQLLPRIKRRLDLIDALTCNTISLEPCNLEQSNYVEHQSIESDFRKLELKNCIVEEKSVPSSTFSIENEAISRAREDLIDMSYKLVKQGQKRKRVMFKQERVEKNAPLPAHISQKLSSK